MRTLSQTFNLFLALCLVFSALTLLPAQPARAAEQPASQQGLTSPESFLNADGTLNLDGSFNGALNLDGYNVSMDPKRGPVFSQASVPAVGDWDSLGGGGSPLNSTVYAVEAIGTDIYVGGNFTDADSIPEADYIAMWDGAAWHAVGSDGNGNGSLNSDVYSLHFDGNYLYAGGFFTDVNNNGSLLTAADYIVRWDGGDWSSLASNGAGSNGSLTGPVRSITDDGQYVYMGGDFYDVNNKGTQLATADFVARWDGTDWAALGNDGAGDGALQGTVYAVAMEGTDLYAGGNFTNAGGNTAADYIAKWNGAAWIALGNNGAGDGAFDSAISVHAIAADYSGNVYVGGNFTDVNNGATNMPDADYFVKWNGSAWSALGTDGVNPAFNSTVLSISFNGLNNLVVSGYFYDVKNQGTILPAADLIAKWDGSNWQAYGDNGSGNGAINNENTVWDIAWGIGGTIYVGGDFEQVKDGATLLPSASYFTYWNGSHWTETGNTPNGSLGNHPSPNVYSLAIMGTDVIVGGNFYDVDNNGVKIWEADYIAKWDGTQWSALGNGLNNTVFTLYVDGHDLYAGGYFSNAGNNFAADRIAKWDGTTWSALGGNGSNNGSLNDVVTAITKVGANLYVGGSFTNVMDVDGSTLADADGLARWDGTHWHAVTNGAGSPIIGSVFALDTDGTNLYVGGNFNNAGGVNEADFLAKWDGSLWSSVGDVMFNGVIYAVKAVGTDLYVGGNFLNAAGIAQADYIAKWDGSAWSALGSNGAGDGALNSAVFTIAYSNGILYVGGEFINAAGVAQADHIAKWNGSNWSALGGNGSGNGSLNDSVFSIVVGDALYAGGKFANVNNNGAVLKTADLAASYGLDFTEPAVQSIVRANPSPTNLASVDFTVTFSEDVTGVDESDFSLTVAGLSGAVGITAVNGSGKTYAVTVLAGSGSGTLGLDVLNDGTIKDTSFNPLSAGYTSGEIYTFDRTAPAVQSIVRANPSPTNLANVNYTVTFSKSVSGVNAADFVLTPGGAVSGAAVSGVSGTGSIYTVTVSTGVGSGTLRLDVVNDGTIKDAALNSLSAGYTSGEVYTVSKSAVFTDVPLNYWANGFIERLYNAHVTGGCVSNPLSYCPDSTVTRAQMAVFLLKGIHGSNYTPPAINGNTGFGDVAVDHWAAAWIKQLSTEGITSGCGAGVYCPEATVTRAQMAVFLLKAKHGASYVPSNATGVFTDVPVGYWADKWIEQLAAEGVTSGCGNGNYCPDAEVTRAQMAVFLVKAFNLP